MLLWSGELFSVCSGILVPGGFGQRGTEGKILAVNYARQRKIPFLGEGEGGGEGEWEGGREDMRERGRKACDDVTHNLSLCDGY